MDQIRAIQPPADSHEPPAPGANLVISVVDEEPRFVAGEVVVSVEYRDFPDKNYRYSVYIGGSGLLGLVPPASDIPATVSLRAVSNGKTSDTLVIKNDEYWEAVEAAELNFVAVHRFYLGKSAIASSANYVSEPTSRLMPISHRFGAGDVLVKLEEGGSMLMAVSPPVLILYGDGTLIYRGYGDLFLHGQLDEPAIQEVLRRVVDKARFFTSRQFYTSRGLHSIFARFTVNTEAQCGSTRFHFISFPKGMTSEEYAQQVRLKELEQWLRHLDLRQADSPGWVDLGEYTPAAISLFVRGPDSSKVASRFEAWPFREDVDLVSLAHKNVQLDGDLARQVFQLLTGSSSSFFSQDGQVFRVRYRPHFPETADQCPQTTLAPAPPSDSLPTPRPNVIAGVIDETGPNLLVSIIDEQGLSVAGKVVVSVEYRDFPAGNYQYSVYIGPMGGKLELAPSPSDKAAVLLQVVTANGRKSDTLVIQTDKFWKAMEATELDYVAIHQFDMGKSATVSRAVYISEPVSVP